VFVGPGGRRLHARVQRYSARTWPSVARRVRRKSTVFRSTCASFAQRFRRPPGGYWLKTSCVAIIVLTNEQITSGCTIIFSYYNRILLFLSFITSPQPLMPIFFPCVSSSSFISNLSFSRQALRRQPEILAAFDHSGDDDLGTTNHSMSTRQAAVVYGESELGALRQALLQVHAQS